MLAKVGMGSSAAALGSPHLKGDTEGKVSNAQKGNKMFFKALYFSMRKTLGRLIWVPLLLCLVLVEKLKLVWFRV